MSARPSASVVGAGLAGSLIACYLGRAGWEVDVWEARPDPREEGFRGGRSINLALSTRGIRALEEVGLADAVLAEAIPMRGRMIHDPSGRLALQPYGTEPHQVIRSVSRAGLNLTLLEAAAALPGVRLAFGWRCVGADLEAPAAELESADGERHRGVAELLVGADGAYSAVRGGMQRGERFDYSQAYLGHGYRELSIPPGPGGSHLLEREALHIWPRGGFMLIALPNPDGSFTCTLFLPFEGRNSFQEIDVGEGVSSFFGHHFPDALALMPELEVEWAGNPVGSMVTVRCAPWHVEDRVVLVGDAAHAVVPFYGQGMNASFEDCSYLARVLAGIARGDAAERIRSGPRGIPGGREEALRRYYEARKPNTDVLADLAIANFLEMRDRVASPLFRVGKAAGRALHRLAPRLFVPLYTMVTFTSLPYAEAVARDRRQKQAASLLGVLLLALLLWLAALA